MVLCADNMRQYIVIGSWDVCGPTVLTYVVFVGLVWGVLFCFFNGSKAQGGLKLTRQLRMTWNS